MKLYTFLFGVSFLLATASAQTLLVSQNGVTVQVFYKGGRVSVRRSIFTNDPADIVMQFTEIKELNKEGDAVGNTFNTFADQLFVGDGKFEDASIPNSDADGNTNTADRHSHHSTLQNPQSTLTAVIYIVKEDVAVTLGTETANLKKGQVKINLQLVSWPWMESGQYLDFVVTIKSYATPMKRAASSGGGLAYDMGADGIMELSKMVSKYRHQRCTACGECVRNRAREGFYKYTKGVYHRYVE